MAKKRDVEDSFENTPQKKHKKQKHKHKKHKHRRDRESASGQSSDTGQSELVEATDSTGKPQLKLKIKIGGQTLKTKSFDKISITASSSEASEDEETSNDSWRGTPPSPVSQSQSQSSGKSKLSKEEEEEEAWLDALEAGKLDEYGEIPKKKDETLLTARQKSLLKRNTTDEGLESPGGHFGTLGKLPEMTEEMIQKRAQKNQKRRVQERRKVEENKKQTIEKLLKKQESKLKAAKAKLKRSLEVPHIRYLNSTNGISLSYPEGHEFPLAGAKAQPARPVISCGITGCTNAKKYSCSKTGIPLCSLECYKKNQRLIAAS